MTLIKPWIIIFGEEMIVLHVSCPDEDVRRLNNSKDRHEVLKVAFPAIGEAYLLNLVGIADMFFISKLGLIAINAVGIVNVYSMTYIGVFIALSSAASIIMSRGKGAKNAVQIRDGFYQGMILATAIGAAIGLLSVLFRIPLLNVMGAESEVLDSAIPYFVIVIGASPLIAWFTSIGAAFRSLGDTTTPFRIGIEMNVVHIILDYIFIFGLGTWEGWGIAGAAVATVLARLYGVIRLLTRLRKTEVMADLHSKLFTAKWPLLWQMTKLAVPAAGERLFMRLGQVLYFGMIVRMGVEVYAAHNIAGTVTTFAYTIGTGFSVAATALIGRSIGEGDLEKANHYRHWTYIYSSISMTLVTIILFLSSPWLGLAFTENQYVISLLMIALGIDIVSQPFLASVLVNTAAIQAGGNTLYPMFVTAAGMWGIRTIGVYLFGVVVGLGLPAVWISIAADNMFRALLFFQYRRKGKWVKELDH